MQKLAIITFRDGRKAYSKYTTVTDSLWPDLYATESLDAPFKMDGEATMFAEVEIPGYETWTCLVRGDTVIAPCQPWSDQFPDRLEGVEEEGVIHLRLLRGCGPALCEHEFADAMHATKYVFTDAYEFTTDLCDRPVLAGSIYDLAESGKVCMRCALHTDVERAMNARN